MPFSAGHVARSPCVRTHNPYLLRAGPRLLLARYALANVSTEELPHLLHTVGRHGQEVRHKEAFVVEILNFALGGRSNPRPPGESAGTVGQSFIFVDLLHSVSAVSFRLV